MMKKILLRCDFEFSSIWIWDNTREFKIPINPKSINSLGSEVYFMKSKFYTNIHQFEGYIVWEGFCNAFTLFLDDDSIKFNANAKSLNEQSIEKVFKKLGSRWSFFPIRFETDVIISSQKVSGVINFEN